SIYDMNNYFVDPDDLNSAFSETVFENTGVSLLTNNFKSLFVLLKENEGVDYSQLFEHLEKVNLLIIRSIFDPKLKTHNIFGFSNQCAIGINQIEISNMWNRIFSSVLDGDFKKLNSVLPNITDIEKELNELKSKLDQLSCVICYEYLFD